MGDLVPQISLFRMLLVSCRVLLRETDFSPNILMYYIDILPLEGYTLQFDLHTDLKILFTSGTQI